MTVASNESEIVFWSATRIREALESGTCTSLELVDALLARIATLDAPGTATALRAVLAVAPDARAQAERCDAERAAGRSVGLLHGIPVLIKDNIDVVGLPTSAGSLALLGAPVQFDAAIVERLREAGAIVLGATNCSEWANIRSGASTSGWSAVGGLTANPWALDRSAGGSSSGSGAAVAAALAPLAIGTETDGSIVCPAAVNGIVGLKPTVGTLPTAGIVPISRSQDTAGPMARTVADVRLLWEALAGEPTASVDVAALRVGVVPQWRSGHRDTDHVFAAVMDALRDADVVAGIDACDVPVMEQQHHDDELTVMLTELHDGLAEYLRERRPDAGVRTLADVVAFNRDHADTELAYFGQEYFEEAVARGGRTSASRNAARRVQTWAREVCLDPALERFDVLVAPTYAPAWKHDFVLGHPNVGGSVTSPAAIAGYPILTVPMGAVHGLPVGLAVVGRPNSESTLLAFAATVERCLALDAQGTWRPRFVERSRG